VKEKCKKRKRKRKRSVHQDERTEIIVDLDLVLDRRKLEAVTTQNELNASKRFLTIAREKSPKKLGVLWSLCTPAAGQEGGGEGAMRCECVCSEERGGGARPPPPPPPHTPGAKGATVFLLNNDERSAGKCSVLRHETKGLIRLIRLTRRPFLVVPRRALFVVPDGARHGIHTVKHFS
jgi:hypothetical protein